ARDQKLYVWARPDAGKTLDAWSLNLKSTDANVIALSGVKVANPVLDLGIGGVRYQRYDHASDVANLTYSEVDYVSPKLQARPDLIYGFKGLAMNFPDSIGIQIQTVGIGLGAATSAWDALYDTGKDAWLLATISYDVLAPGKTDLFLQVGAAGIKNQRELSRDHRVVFGRPDDPPLRGGEYFSGGEWINERGTDSATPDATIVVLAAVASNAGAVPEPSGFVLAALGILSILALAPKGQRHGRRS
ncbi:MAG: hypothetical protein ACC628_19095, partial [Pirellulaceae bacterium]